MLFKTFSAAVYGIDANIIEVEVDVSGIRTNEDHFHTVGLPDAAVRESRERVRSDQQVISACRGQRGQHLGEVAIHGKCLP